MQKQMKVILMKGKSISLSVACCHILLMIFYLFDSDNKNDEYEDFSLSAMIQQSWSKRKHLLEHDFAITGWVLSLLPEIREDVAERMDGNARMAIKQVITKLHAPPNPNPKTSEEPLEIILVSFGRNLMISRIRLDPMDIVLEDS